MVNLLLKTHQKSMIGMQENFSFEWLIPYHTNELGADGFRFISGRLAVLGRRTDETIPDDRCCFLPCRSPM